MTDAIKKVLSRMHQPSQARPSQRGRVPQTPDFEEEPIGDEPIDEPDERDLPQMPIPSNVRKETKSNEKQQELEEKQKQEINALFNEGIYRYELLFRLDQLNQSLTVLNSLILRAVGEDEEKE